MTTLAAILALLQLVLTLGERTGLQQLLAVAIVTGFLQRFPMVPIALSSVIHFAMRGL